MKKNIPIIFCLAGLLILNTQSRAQQLVLPAGYPPVNINISAGASDGYFFWGPMPIGSNTPGYLIIMDNYGTPVYYKQATTKTYCFQPYPTGVLAYFDGGIRKFVSVDSSYMPVDTMECVGCDRFDMHELRIFENGNYMLSGFKYRIVDMSLVVPGGNPAATIIDYLIQEFNAAGQVVFEWNTANYYAITDVDDKVDLTTSTIDPTSFCSIEVDTDTTMLLSMAHQNEITKIDRRTGAIIWRMGGKNNQFTFINNTRSFTRQHDVRRLPNGNITMIDAGVFSTPFYSRAVEYAIDEKNKTATQVWEYDHNKTIQSTHKGSVQRLPNGNTLIGWGGFGGTLPTVPGATEVKPDGTIVFEAGTPSSDGSYRFRKYPWKTTLFEPVTDSINYGKWNGYTESVYLLVVKNNSDNPITLTGASTRTTYFYVDEQFPITIPSKDMTFLKVVFYPLGAAPNTSLTDVVTINNDDLVKKQRIAIQVQLKGSVPDMISPVVSFNPDNNILAQGDPVRISFSEPIRNTDNSEITNLNLASLLIFRSADINGMNIPFNATINPEKTEITITPSETLVTGQNYFLQINTVEDLSDNPTIPQSRTYTVTVPTSVVLSGMTAKWEIFPNPVRGKLNIRTNDDLKYRLELFDGTGKLLRTVLDLQSSGEINMTGLAEGLYFLKVTAIKSGFTKTVRVVKNSN